VSRLLDLSPVISARIAVWPGDVPFREDFALRMAEGAHLELSSLTTTVHVGAHADAPSHYLLGGAGIGERPLERYYGPCQVMRVEVGRGERVGVEHLTGPVRAPRLLLRTGTFPDPERWNEDFAALAPTLVAHLAAAGVVLVGIDTPSIDLMTSKDLPAHKAVAAADMAVLEGLLLDDAPEGVHTLIALPLRIEGADASPVRAALLVQEAS
jgi:arylformamidase